MGQNGSKTYHNDTQQLNDAIQDIETKFIHIKAGLDDSKDDGDEKQRLQGDLVKLTADVELVRVGSKRKKEREKCRQLLDTINDTLKQTNENAIDVETVSSKSFVPMRRNSRSKRYSRASGAPLDEHNMAVTRLGAEIKDAITGADLDRLQVLEKKIDVLYGELERLKLGPHEDEIRAHLCTNLQKFGRKIIKTKELFNENVPVESPTPQQNFILEEINNELVKYQQIIASDDYDSKVVNANLRDLFAKLDVEKSQLPGSMRRDVVETRHKIKELLQRIKDREKQIDDCGSPVPPAPLNDIIECETQVEQFDGYKDSDAYNTLTQRLYELWSRMDGVRDKSDAIQRIQACLKTLNNKAMHNARRSLPKDALGKQFELFKYNWEQLQSALREKNISEHKALRDGLLAIKHGIDAILLCKTPLETSLDAPSSDEVRTKLDSIELDLDLIRIAIDEFPSGEQNPALHTDLDERLIGLIIALDTLSIQSDLDERRAKILHDIQILTDRLRKNDRMVTVRELQRIANALVDVNRRIGEFLGMREDRSFNQLENELMAMYKALDAYTPPASDTAMTDTIAKLRGDVQASIKYLDETAESNMYEGTQV